MFARSSVRQWLHAPIVAGIELMLAVLIGSGLFAPWAGEAHAAAATATAAPVAVASAEPLFAASFKGFDRKPQALAQFKGKPMVVYFWATWCKSCKKEVPELIALHAKYGSQINVVGIAIDNTDKVQAFARDHQINYPVLIGSNDALALSKQLGNSVGGLPFAVVVDAAGRVTQTLLGETPPGKFEELVRPLIR